jgi:hypothetical protein
MLTKEIDSMNIGKEEKARNFRPGLAVILIRAAQP